jgi:hypothetical protein
MILLYSSKAHFHMTETFKNNTIGNGVPSFYGENTFLLYMILPKMEK